MGFWNMVADIVVRSRKAKAKRARRERVTKGVRGGMLLAGYVR
jgi:hypothetical protein